MAMRAFARRGYAAELFDLTGDVVLVTGGSRGLGREMAFAAAHCGADGNGDCNGHRASHSESPCHGSRQHPYVVEHELPEAGAVSEQALETKFR